MPQLCREPQITAICTKDQQPKHRLLYSMEACFNAKEPVPAPVTDRVLAKGCQHTESFTQETQDKQESQEAQAAQGSQELQAIHVLHDRRKLEEKECVDGEAQTDIETAVASHRLPGIETFTVYAFPFASCLRGIELRHHFRFGPVLLRSIYDKWADNNHQFLTGDRDYYSEFLAMMSKVRFPTVFAACASSCQGKSHSYPCVVVSAAGAVVGEVMQGITRSERR
ncbi:MAG: hypothetical protein H0W34_14625 [Pyrinomonadaceae bacterium]|nr:hypothetical protein [Pyrinomonadaceae bacterium]